MTQQANCKITARLDNGDIFEENVSVIWINDKTGAVTVKLKSGAYLSFPIERVMRLEWIPLARVVQRSGIWGFDAPEGFAGFGPLEGDRKLAEYSCSNYNSGDTLGWAYRPICDQKPQPPSD